MRGNGGEEGSGETVTHGVRGGGGARFDPQLREEIRHVETGGTRADEERLRDLSILEAAREQAQHLNFARGQISV